MRGKLVILRRRHHLLPLNKAKTWGRRFGDAVEKMEVFSCEKVLLLSKILGNRTVGFRRSKKGKRSTRSRLRVDPGFASFEKLQEVGVSPYLCFIPILSVFRCLGWFEAVRGV